MGLRDRIHKKRAALIASTVDDKKMEAARKAAEDARIAAAKLKADEMARVKKEAAEKRAAENASEKANSLKALSEGTARAIKARKTRKKEGK